MPSYAKFLTDILAKKRRINDFQTMALRQATSDIYKNGVLEKMTYPGSFKVPCSIDGMDLGHVLCDLGASINLMPLSIFKKLKIKEVQPTHMRFQLADRSITNPKGKIEDVLVKVDKFLFFADFIILDYEADEEVLIILRRLFLSTGRALTYVHQGELTVFFNNKEIKFNVVNAMKFPLDDESCNAIESLVWGYCEEEV
ncbi:uncharacterized protein LOC103490055 [Cucumis melo]|uniref:Uncharacterized protein LOC103490055 n=1 Tax=Cucumis melo TaxID=3656 RepID=A0A1S3BHX3_CUCME|nr:uncharacterized protein LOC103490055 [Cucumis melo]